MARALILACGNPLRGDDGVGLRIVEELKRVCRSEEIEIAVAQQLLPEMAEQISEAEIVIFVDASVTQEPGSIAFEPVVTSEGDSESFTHRLSPQTLLRLAGTLYGRSPAHAFALNVGVGSCELNEGLSEPARSSIPQAVGTILDFFAREISRPIQVVPGS